MIHHGGLYQGGLSSGWFFMWVVSDQFGLSSGQSFIWLVVFHGGPSSGVLLYAGLRLPMLKQQVKARTFIHSHFILAGN